MAAVVKGLTLDNLQTTTYDLQSSFPHVGYSLHPAQALQGCGAGEGLKYPEGRGSSSSSHPRSSQVPAAEDSRCWGGFRWRDLLLVCLVEVGRRDLIEVEIELRVLCGSGGGAGGPPGGAGGARAGAAACRNTQRRWRAGVQMHFDRLTLPRGACGGGCGYNALPLARASSARRPGSAPPVLPAGKCCEPGGARTCDDEHAGKPRLALCLFLQGRLRISGC